MTKNGQMKPRWPRHLRIEVHRIPVPKDRLRALPKDERVLLLLLGYVSNQVLMLQKLLIYATRLDPKDEVEQHATGVQTQMLVRIAVSAPPGSGHSPELRKRAQGLVVPTVSCRLAPRLERGSPRAPCKLLPARSSAIFGVT